MGAAFPPRNRLFHRTDLPNRVACDEFLGCGEWTVDHGALVSGKSNPLALRTRLQSAEGQHHPRLPEFLVELAHILQPLLFRHNAGFRFFRGLADYHDSHWTASFVAQFSE